MKRIVTLMVALGVVVAACGSGNDDTVATSAPVATDETSEDAEPSAEDDATAEEPAAEEPTTKETAESEDDDGDASAIGPISSLDDIPKRCRDLMADFLREIEPLVSPLDWQTASLSEFEAIGEDFEAMSDDFDTRGELAGCNDLDFVGDSEFDLMAEFARDEAPGTVGFLEFIAAIGSGLSDDDGDTTASGSEIETCDDGVAFMQDLVDNYDTITDAPASELLKFQQLSLVFITCTPEQLEFFDSPDVLAFMGE